MTESRAQKIFDKYNPKDAVRRCPNGRAVVRNSLDIYVKAAVNLYGVIHKKEFVEIFNKQNIVQTTEDEIFILLLPLVLKKRWYCFYKNYIVHYSAIDDFDFADYLIREQADKPRFIPEKEEFLKFDGQYYESETQFVSWRRLFHFIHEEWADNRKRYLVYSELREFPELGISFKEASHILDKYNMVFSSEKQAQMFFNLLTDACNNTRLWANKGYSPNELREIYESQHARNGSPEMVLHKRKRVGPNEPCPCGSGKKYKKCCRIIEESKTAQLSRDECMLFYETWYGLMEFINNQRKVINAVIKPIYPNPVSDEQIYKVREVLWENPKLIDEYLDSVTLTDEKTELLKSWRDHHKKDMFFLIDYKPEYAVVIGSNEQKGDRLYGVKGISRSMADAMQRELPIQIEAVLLPFKDKIIYDSFISSMNISYAEGAKRALREMYQNALEDGILTRLD